MVFVVVVVVVALAASGALVYVGSRLPEFRRECLGGVGLVLVGAALFIVLFRPVPTRPAGVCNAGMDASGSAQETEIVDGYLRALPAFLEEHCLDARGGEVGVITAHSLNEPGQTVALDFAPEPGRNARRAHDAAQQAIGGTVVPSAEAMLASASTTDSGTDIIGYLDRIDDTYAAAPSNERYLLLLTDGGQTRTLNVYRDPLGPDDIDRYLASLEDEGRLPELDGVRVWMIGANLGQVAEGVSAERTAQIESFWRAFFRATGAEIEKYGPSL